MNKSNINDYHDKILMEAELTSIEIKKIFQSAGQSAVGDKTEELDKLIDKIYTSTEAFDDDLSDPGIKNDAEEKFNDIANEIKSKTTHHGILGKIGQLGNYIKEHPGNIIVGIGALAATLALLKSGREEEAEETLHKIANPHIESNPAGSHNILRRESLEEGFFDKMVSKISDIANDIGTSRQIKKVKQKSIRSKDDISYNSLVQAWMRNNRPTDSDEIIKMLKREGLSNADIKKVFRNAGVPLSVKRDEIVIKLAHIAKKHKLNDLLIAHLEKDHNIKMGESTEAIKYIVEAELSDSEIKNIFQVLVKKDQTENKNKTANEMVSDINSWAKELNKMTSEDEKINSIKNVISLLADNKAHPNWAELSKMVQDVVLSSNISPNVIDDAIVSIKSGKVMEKSRYLACTLLLSECFLTWSSLSLKPIRVDENSYQLYNLVSGKPILLEEFFLDLLVYDKIDTLQ